MYNKIYGLPTTSGIRGTHYIPGTDYVYYVRAGNPNGFIERVRITPLEQVAQGSAVFNKTSQFNLDDGVNDLDWKGTTLKGLGTTKLYKFASPPVNGLLGVVPTTLPALTYQPTSTSFTETGLVDNYYAAQIGSSGNYAVFRIYSYTDPNPPGATKTKIDWFTYKLNATPTNAGFGAPPDPRDLYIAPDGKSVYISAMDDSGAGHVYSIPNRGTVTGPDFTPPASAGGYQSYAIDSDGFNGPQQLAYDNGLIYVVDDTTLWRVDPAALSQTPVVSGLNGGTGLLIDSASQKAYLSDASGQLYVVDLAAATPTLATLPPPLTPLEGAAGHMNWADDKHTAFYVTLTDPLNKVLRINLAGLSQSTVLEAGPVNPTGFEVLSDCRLFLASDTEVGDIDTCIMQVGNNVLLGIGLVPFDFIKSSTDVPAVPQEDYGKADTTSAVGYFYQVKNVPFGGSLSLMVNHKQAYTNGLRYYRVTLIRENGSVVPITGQFTDLRWNALASPPRFAAVATTSTGKTPPANVPKDAFPIRDPNDLWYNPFLSAIVPTTTAENGLATLKVEFFNQAGVGSLALTYSHVIRIDNNRCSGTISMPRIAGSTPSLDCGCIPYSSKNDTVVLDFTAWHPLGFGTYTIQCSRGGAGLPALTESGSVDSVSTAHVKDQTKLPASPTFKVGHLLGNCDIANVSVSLNIPAGVIDGYRWVDLGAHTGVSFTLAPASALTSSPWVDPGG